ncbi:hypothetical protein LguiA_022741 [Lonicera macranthoides]
MDYHFMTKQEFQIFKQMIMESEMDSQVDETQIFLVKLSFRVTSTNKSSNLTSTNHNHRKVLLINDSLLCYLQEEVSTGGWSSSESKPVASQDNLSLFQNVQPSKTAVSSSNDVSSNAFTGWDANFQSADSGN